MNAVSKRSITSTLATSEQGRGILYLADPSRAWVSLRSRFGDAIWWIDVQTPGQHNAVGRFDWEFEVSDGLKFSHPKFDVLRGTLKRFVWSLFCERVNGLELKAGSLRKVQIGVKSLVRWMCRNDYVALCELTSSSSEEYLEDVQEECRKWIFSGRDEQFQDRETGGDLEAPDEKNDIEGEDVEISEGQLRPRLQMWSHLWSQREVMLRFGSDALPEAPFSGRSAKSLSQELATKAEGWIPPVPDDVAIPIMREARRWLYDRAQDILTLQDAYLDAYDESDGCVEMHRSNCAKKAFDSFTFSVDPLTGRPWREPIAPGLRNTLFDGKWRQAQLTTHDVFRNLVQDLCAACVIVIQSESGLRINEMCGLKAGRPSANGIAACVESRGSKTGLNENFFLKGLLSKLQRGPREVEWLIGSRPVDSSEVPAPVRACWVLERLFERLRERAAKVELRDALIIQFTTSRGFPRDGVQIGRALTGYLRDLQRQFVGNNVNLSALPDRNKQGENLAEYRDSKGGCLRTHSWRKTFALYVFRTDPRMTPAIAQQFHHLSLAMTEEGYLGNDPTLLAVIDSVHYEQSALVFYELARGERPAVGRMAKLVDEFRDELGRFTAGNSRAEGLEATHRWVVQEDLRIWFSRHGKCFLRIAPAKARCHELGDSVHWANREPNFAFRTPDVCLGCPLYEVDKDHENFWRTRFAENASLLTYGSLGRGARLVAELRARQSRVLLSSIGVEVDKPEQLDA